MSQNDFVIADQTFPETLADLNAAFQALGSNSSGETAPTTTYPFQFWADETTNLLKIRNKANNVWLTLAKIDPATDMWELRANIFQALTAAGFVLKNAAGATVLSIDNSGALTLGSNTIKGAAVETFTDLRKGAVPASGGGVDKLLRGDGTWAALTLATTLEATAGTGTGIMDATLVKAAIAAQLDATGFKKVWQTVTRLPDTTYQNTESYPLEVLFKCVAAGTVTGYIDIGPTAGSLVERVMTTIGGGWGATYAIVVPSGWYYKLRRQSTYLSISSTSERSL